VNPFIELRKRLATERAAAQIAARDPYADLEDVMRLERGRGISFVRDGARIVGPGPFSPGSADEPRRGGPTGTRR
jgi:hypothetical protein